jgi:hypothetical protein
MHVISTLAVLAADPKIDPTASAMKFRAFLVLCLGIALLIASLSAVIGAGRKGNNAKAASIMSASLIGLIPGVIGIGIGALAFGAAFLNWAIPGLS